MLLASRVRSSLPTAGHVTVPSLDPPASASAALRKPATADDARSCLFHVDFGAMLLVVVAEGNRPVGLLDAVARDALDRPAGAAATPDMDVIDRLGYR